MMVANSCEWVLHIQSGGLDPQVDNHHFKEKGAQKQEQSLLMHKCYRKKAERDNQTEGLLKVLVLIGLSSRFFLKGKGIWLWGLGNERKRTGVTGDDINGGTWTLTMLCWCCIYFWMCGMADVCVPWTLSNTEWFMALEKKNTCREAMVGQVTDHTESPLQLKHKKTAQDSKRQI